MRKVLPAVLATLTLAFATSSANAFDRNLSFDRMLNDGLVLQVAKTSSVTEVSWENLIPEGADQELTFGIKEHSLDLNAIPEEPKLTESMGKVVTKFNGQTVKIAGFMVPLDFESAEVSEFLLVPYVGACIHVPPPPPNQIVYVSTTKKIAVVDMWEPIEITGTFSSQTVQTELADTGYTMTLQKIGVYKEDN